MNPNVIRATNARNSLSNNDLRYRNESSVEVRAAKSGAIEAWMLACPVPLTLEGRAAIITLIRNDRAPDRSLILSIIRRLRS